MTRPRNKGAKGNRKSSSTLATAVLAFGMLFTGISGAKGQNAPGLRSYSQIPTGAYSVVAEVQAKPGKERELLAATVPLVQLVRSDPKNLVYFLQEDRERKGHLLFFEVYASKADFEAHNNKPYVQSWFTKLPSLTVGPLKTTKMEVLNNIRK